MNDNAPNEKLREHVTGQAFAMTLSRSMVAMLDALARNARSREREPQIRNWISTGHSLEERGLISWRGTPQEPFARTRVERGAIPPVSDRIRLTKAGWIMHDLLAEAGLVKAIDKRASVRRLVA
jgi:hypothetical protein